MCRCIIEILNILRICAPPQKILQQNYKKCGRLPTLNPKDFLFCNSFYNRSLKHPFSYLSTQNMPNTAPHLPEQSSTAQSSTMFNPQYNSFNVASKIVVALERISEAFRVMLWQESKENGLSPLQIQILIFLHFHTHHKNKVSFLAQEFNMTKPTISDAVRVLEQKHLIRKHQDEADTRSYSMTLTDAGKHIANKAASFAERFDAPMLAMSPFEQEMLLGQLLKIIDSFQQQGILTKSGNCFSCIFFQKNAFTSANECSFLKQTLHNADIRVDCPHHEERP